MLRHLAHNSFKIVSAGCKIVVKKSQQVKSEREISFDVTSNSNEEEGRDQSSMALKVVQVRVPGINLVKTERFFVFSLVS